MKEKITIKYIERTCLNKNAYVKLVRKFGKLKYKMLIVFDNRIKDYRSIFF